MFTRFNETVLKVIIIVAIIVMFITLYTTGIAFVLGSYTFSNLLLHKLAALIIIGLLGVHAWLRRCTIRKLLQESIAIILNKHIRNEDNIDFLIQNTKHQSFHALCVLFHFDADFMREKLLENHIAVEKDEDTLKTIAKHNDKDMYQILLLMMKLHVEKNNPSPILINSCDRV
ncbi:hypothetical protein FA592_08900 [Sulfurospirillum diekertiae]|uniref:Uncharacterized protein n=1 Tax=Sulfurospirillum diekertiae TaxID=1854492 RepID=A0A6G9VVE2_9BACT|nr:hypothetical protein [Sulfurospirillum diekertiae]QIR76344.1 hypothetical protein FA584_09040 [Sulfurospirillum diekertiae]QIR78974.1 hypothetical protein FA592_08900 [Sulfurospirillum diekertiae]